MKQGRKLSIFLPNVSHRTRSESFHFTVLEWIISRVKTDIFPANREKKQITANELDSSQEVGEILRDYAFTLMFFKATKTFSQFVGIFAEKKNNNFIVFANFIMIVRLG